MSDKYKISDLIEKGSFSEVYKFINKNNSCVYAGKIIPFEKFKKGNSFYSEETILKQLDHPNIIKFIESFEDSENHYIITDYYPNGNLHDFCLIRENKVNKLTEIEIKYYVLQIVNALIYLKKNNIVHRDIKLQHLLLTDKLKLKLCGFHCAKKLSIEKDKITGISGTKVYMAPEVLKNRYYSFEVDVWSLGILIYKLYTGYSPFKGKNYDEFYENIMTRKNTFLNDCDISPLAKDLIQKILVVEPSNRLTIEKVLSHDFFQFGIPKSLPLSTLKEPPPKDFIDRYSQKHSIKIGEKNCEEENILLKKKLIITDKLLIKEKNLTQQLSERIKLLEGQLREEKKKNMDLVEKNKEFEKIKNSYNNKDSMMNLMNKLLSKEEEIQELKSRYPFELLKDEKLLSLIFVSCNQEIHYSIICKDSDKFTIVENLLYDEYPKYRESENYFLFNGEKINKYKTLKENNLKNGSIILLNQFNEED